MRTAFPDPQFAWLRRADKVRQGISWWRADVTGQWGQRPGQEPEQPAPDVERIVGLVQFAQQCEDGWRRWFGATGIQPCEVLYEDLSGTGSLSRTQSWSSSAFRDSMQATCRPFATASTPTA